MALTPIQAIARLPVDGEILHKITQGPATGPSSQVQTENGLVSTAARAISLVQAVSAQAIGEIQALAAAQGYQVPVAYAAGIVLTTANQTVEHNGQTYAPISSALPFTTSGTFEADKFRLIQGVSAADLAASTGASGVGFAQNLTGAATRSAQDKLAEIKSVTDWPIGPRLHSDMFSAAVQNAPGVDNVPPPYNAIPHPITVVLRVPAGDFKLPDLVDTQGREAVYIVDPGAKFDNIDNLNGTIIRDGFRKTKRFPLGTLDQATGHYFAVGTSSNDRNPPVLGVTSTQQMADYAQRDAVGLVAAAYSYKYLVNAGTATYTATTATIGALDSDTVKRLRRGMVIYTGHATRCCGILDGWSSDGSTLSVMEWRAKGGTAAVTPADGIGLTIGTDKLWAMNAVVNLEADGSVTQGIGIEISARNHKGDSSTDIDNPLYRMWGVLSSTEAAGVPGTYQSQAAFVANGNWYYGIVSHSQQVGVYVQSPSTQLGYLYKGVGYVMQVINATTGNLSYRLNYTGDVEIGQREVASTSGKSFRFNTSGNPSNGGDVTIIASGGTSAFGNGSLAINAIDTRFQGVVRPATSNVWDLGSATYLWKTIYGASGAVSTSDARLKTLRGDGGFTDDELDAWGDVSQKVYQFNSAIALKSAEDARLHAGYLAQDFQAAFAARGLDASRYGFWCQDEVTEVVREVQSVTRQKRDVKQTEQVYVDVVDGVPVQKKRTIEEEVDALEMVQVVDENGTPLFREYEVTRTDDDGNSHKATVVEPITYGIPVMETVEMEVEVTRPAGTRLGLRYEECAVWEAAYMRREVAKLTAEIVALKNPGGSAPQTTNP
ncbi:hypothetical protein DIE14_21860 [Burkholderia sp. Bp9017]|uniref:tail fiber domain-containing protein n=1 Tax=unclassified Burkholderia TaxID=2613784 RepID=UPI000F5D8F6D|nr:MULTISPECIES: tail fiber domain-containing protein [unclassified Burkholderia]RQZ24163.1 hypothetical protein DIE14_21860 [Burkholderia sp. Bp9017]RQZ32133.1 hypothetical protein DIE13_21740 [Burkholderia sp. Bp9016]